MQTDIFTNHHRRSIRLPGYDYSQPGAYFITFCLTENDRKWVDCVERALAIQVQPADVFGSGRVPDSTYGPFFTSWNVTVKRGDDAPAHLHNFSCEAARTDSTFPEPQV